MSHWKTIFKNAFILLQVHKDLTTSDTLISNASIFAATAEHYNVQIYIYF